MKLLRKPFETAFVNPDPMDAMKVCELHFAKEWKDLPCPGIPRRFCALAMWGTDKMIIVGGCDQEGQMLKSVEVYDFSKYEWTFLPSLCEPREDGVAIVVETKLYVFGGFGQGSYVSECEVLDLCKPELGFSCLQNDLPQPLKGAVAVSNGHWIYIVGGYHAKAGYLNTVFALDTHSLVWDDTFPNLGTARHLPAVTVFENTLVVAGGRSLGNGGKVKYLKSVESINLAIGTHWNYMAPLISSRAGAVAFVFNGSLFVAGGEVRENVLATMLQRYDGIQWRQKPFRNTIRPCPGSLVMSVSRMTMISMENPLDFKFLSCASSPSTNGDDAVLKFDHRKLQRLEQDLQSQPSIERICEFMRIFQFVMEWDEEHGSQQHGKIAVQIRKLLTQPHITKLLKEKGPSYSENVRDTAKNDFFISDAEDDELLPASDDRGVSRTERTIPIVINVRSHFSPDDSSAITMADHIDEFIDVADDILPKDNPVVAASANKPAAKLTNVRSHFATDNSSALTMADHIDESIDVSDDILPKVNPVVTTSASKPAAKPTKVIPARTSTIKPVTQSTRVVTPEKGGSKVSPVVVTPTKSAVEARRRVVSPDRGKDKMWSSNLSEADTVTKFDSSYLPYRGKDKIWSSNLSAADTITTFDSSSLPYLGKPSRRRVSKTASSTPRPAIRLRAVEAICDDDGEEGLWV